ncbi:hypothetical protein GcM1_214017 [Golovinomyces cichoracearum]|uniref:Uncharacterized protein n=1 Tax=Golovinomyces cichoracearum TaxID=62708 RepID=A0A420IU28_9PEZI|nr:hypothetical protein GcM1_214017 [Golovinomyces cichoracearum]
MSLTKASSDQNPSSNLIMLSPNLWNPQYITNRLGILSPAISLAPELVSGMFAASAQSWKNSPKYFESCTPKSVSQSYITKQLVFSRQEFVTLFELLKFLYQTVGIRTYTAITKGSITIWNIFMSLTNPKI